MYQLIFYKSKLLKKDRDFLKKYETSEEQVKNALLQLAENPFSRGNLDVKKLQNSGEKGIMRLRSGSFRIIFDIDTNNKVIIVYRIKQRKEGYD